jgi:flagellar assembly protein FliH
MGLIKRADIETYSRDACVMDLSDLKKRGDHLVSSANEKATQIIHEAQKQREQLISTAEAEGREQGYEQGFREGMEAGKAEGIEQARAEHTQIFDQLVTLWGDQLGAFEQRRDEMIEAARVQLIELAGMIASRVVRRTIELDPCVVERELESVLSTITEPTRLVISVHPDDAERARDALPALIDRFASCEHAQIVTDPSLSLGSCVARTPSGGVIDASIDEQLRRIIDAMLPAGRTQSPSLGIDDTESHGDDREAQGDAA